MQHTIYFAATELSQQKPVNPQEGVLPHPGSAQTSYPVVETISPGATLAPLLGHLILRPLVGCSLWFCFALVAEISVQ